MSVALIREHYDYHHWANRRLFGLVHRVGERAARVLVDRVAALLPVERDEADRAAPLDTYHRARLTFRRSRR